LVWKEVSSSKVTEIRLGDLEYAVTGLEFDEDGNILTSVGQDGTIIHWDMDPRSWEFHACRRVSRNFTSSEWSLFIGDEAPYPTCLR
jgi:WD40 repeat protein